MSYSPYGEIVRLLGRFVKEGVSICVIFVATSLGRKKIATMSSSV